MFKELMSAKGQAEYDLYSSCEALENVYAEWCKWLVVPDGSNRFKWTADKEGGVSLLTPVGNVFTTRALVTKADGEPAMRVVFYQLPDQRLGRDPVPLFSVNIDENWTVRSGDDPNGREWPPSGNGTWVRRERERLGYEVLLGQLANGGRLA